MINDDNIALVRYILKKNEVYEVWFAIASITWSGRGRWGGGQKLH